MKLLSFLSLPFRAIAGAFALLALLGLLTLAPRIAHASPKSDAARLKVEGDAFMDQERFADALASYKRAYELSGDPALLYNQARALEPLGEYPDALDKLEQFESEASPALRSRVPGLKDLMTELRGHIATLVVRTNATDAHLVLRQKVIGRVGKDMRVRTRAGPATIEITAEGYEPFRRELDLPAGQTTTVDAELVSKKSQDALVAVKTQPLANLVVDGKPRGRAPIELRLGPGAHDLVASADGYDDQRIVLSLAGGDRRDLDLSLEKSSGVTSKWWFWTGVAAVVVGGVVATYALVTEKPAPRGTFDPGEVRVP